MSAPYKTGSPRTTQHDVGAAEYARSLSEPSLDPLVTISPDGKVTDRALSGVLSNPVIGPS